MDLRRDLLTHDQEPPTFTNMFDLLRDCQLFVRVLFQKLAHKCGSVLTCFHYQKEKFLNANFLAYIGICFIGY